MWYRGVEMWCCYQDQSCGNLGLTRVVDDSDAVTVTCLLLIVMQVATMCITMPMSNFLGKQERQGMLHNAALSFVQCQLVGDCITIKGCQEQVDKVKGKRQAPMHCSPSYRLVIARSGIWTLGQATQLYGIAMCS